MGNVVNGVLHSNLASVFHAVRADDAKVVVLTGAGDTFCGSGDPDWFPDIEREEWLHTIRQVRWIMRDLMLLEQPVIAKLNGPSLGVGTSLVLASDLIYTSERGSIADPHTQFGIAAGDGAAALLPNLVSLTKAKEILFLGKPVVGRQLVDLGIANELVPQAELDAKVDEVAHALAAQPKQSLRWTKTIVNKWADNAITSLLDTAIGYEGWTWELPGQDEAMAAFNAAH